MTTVYDELADVRELSAVQVEEWLGRRHGWAKRHIFELGGYFEGQYRFPIHGIRAWQQRQAAEYAEQRKAS